MRIITDPIMAGIAKTAGRAEDEEYMKLCEPIPTPYTDAIINNNKGDTEMNNESAPTNTLTDDQMNERLHHILGQSAATQDAVDRCMATNNLSRFNNYATACADGGILIDPELKRLVALFASGIDDIQTGRAVLNM